MWVMLTDSFLSVVEDTNHPGNLLVRARAEGDIEKVFPGAVVFTTPSGDYGWRTSLDRMTVKEAMVNEVGRIDYSNFKNATPEDDRHNAYLKCWVAMVEFQAGRQVRTKRKKRK